MKNLLAFTLLGTTLLLGTSPTRAEWHRFRGPNGNGYIAGNTKLPTVLGKETLAWKAPLP